MTRRSVLVAAAVLALSGGLLPAHAAVQPRLSAPAATPVDRANALLAQMTLAEKVAMMHQGASCANRTAIGPWESFDEIDQGNGNIALRAHANGNIVTADNAGASPLIANRTAVGQWETFGLIHNADGSVSLQAKANNNFVTAENAGAAPLIANRTAIGPWEEFDLIND
jgi:hypothetical protein